MDYSGSLLITFMRSVKPTGMWPAVGPMRLYRIVGKSKTVKCIYDYLSKDDEKGKSPRK
jgi:hypothetical protein